MFPSSGRNTTALRDVLDCCGAEVWGRNTCTQGGEGGDAVKRYDVGYKDNYGFFCCGYGKEDADGEWVRYEDAASLQQRLAEARAALSDMGVWLPWASELFPGDDIEAWKVKHAAALKAAREAK